MNDELIPRTMMLIGFLAFAFPATSYASFSVAISVGFAPPALPLYLQPPCPASGYIWTPGYWAYSAETADYFWVPGTWVVAAEPGLLWTPGYWALGAGAYLWNAGYWASHVGFYGGINYGYGYFGSGFEGGYWRDHDFYYNQAVMNISNVNVTNVYNRSVPDTNYYGTRPSFNGAAGVHASPTRSDLAAAHEPHHSITQPQILQATSAQNVPALRASINHGYPSVAATTGPGAFQSRDVVPAHYANAALSRDPQQFSARGQSLAPRGSQPAYNSFGARAHSGAATQQEDQTMRTQWRSPAQATMVRRAPLAHQAPTASYSPRPVYRPASSAAYSRSHYGDSYTPPTRELFRQVPQNSSASRYSPPAQAPAARQLPLAQQAPVASFRPIQRFAQAPRNSVAPHPAQAREAPLQGQERRR